MIFYLLFSTRASLERFIADNNWIIQLMNTLAVFTSLFPSRTVQSLRPLALWLCLTLCSNLNVQAELTNVFAHKGVWPGHASDSIDDVVISGNYAYLFRTDNTHGGLVVVDISNPRIPSAVGGYQPGGNFTCVEGITVTGNYAYLAVFGNGNCFEIVDVSNPASPKLVGGYRVVGSSSGNIAAAIAGNYAFIIGTSSGYATDPTAGMAVLDISNPMDPQPLSGYKAASFNDLAVTGNYIYVANLTNDFDVVDISNPLTPQRVGGGLVTGGISNFKVFDKKLLIVTQTGKIEMFDIIDPIKPTRIGGYSASDDIAGITVSGNYLYAAANALGLQIVDITDPAVPRLIGRYKTRGYAHHVAVAGNYAFITGSTGDLEVVDISNPQSPQHAGGYSTRRSSSRFAVFPNRVYLASGAAGLQTIDITNPDAPRLLGTYDTSGNALDVAVIGTNAYVADGSAGLQIIDISDSSAPKRMGGLDTPGDARRVFVSDNKAYVADGAAGFQIIDISNSTSPVRVGGLDTLGTAYNVTVADNLAYVADGTNGLQIVNISDPAVLQVVGGLDTLGNAYDVVLADHLACVADGTNGLQIIDVSNPDTPLLVGGYVTTNSFTAVSVSGNRAYVANGTNGVLALDISNPATPLNLGSCGSGTVAGLVGTDDWLYMTEASQGLHILNSNIRTIQTLTFNAITDQIISNAPVVMEATASSDLPVTFTVVSGPASTSNNILTWTNTGTISVRAMQEGNDVYAAAAPVERSFQVSKLTQVLSFDILPAAPLLNQHLPIGIHSSAGLPVLLEVVNGPATIENGLLILTNSGPVTVRAEQPGNAVYLPRTLYQVLFDASAHIGQVGAWKDLDLGTAQSVVVSGDYAYVGAEKAGLVVLDIHNPAAPQCVGVYATPGSYQRVSISKGFLYLVDGTSTLQIFDISEPTALQPVGQFVYSNLNDVTVVGNYAYIAYGYYFFPSGPLLVLDIRNPAAPRFMGREFNSSKFASRIEMSGDYAYAISSSRLFAVDISNPIQPISFAGGYYSKSVIAALAMSGNHVYLASHASGITVLDVHNPNDFKLTGTCVPGGSALGVALSGNYAYIASDDKGLQVIDVSNPAAPTLLGGYDTGGQAQDVTVAGNYVYVASGTNGLVIFPTEAWFPQAVTFDAIPDQHGVNGSVALQAKSSSGLPVTFSLVSGPATINSNLLTWTNLGAVTVRVTQEGNAVTAPAMPVEQSFQILPLTLTLGMEMLEGQWTLAWPEDLDDCQLKSATNLVPPVTWQPVQAEIITSNGMRRIHLPTNGLPQEYFRLEKP
jgi:hypothetical protein